MDVVYGGENVTLKEEWYQDNGNRALVMLEENGMMYGMCSVNPGVKLAEDVICIKDYSENEGMVDWLRELGVIGKQVQEIPSGFVSLGVYEYKGL